LLATVALAAARERKLPKPGWNLFKKEQDIQLGKEYAQQIERHYYVVPDAELTAYVNRIGHRLVEKGDLEPYPYYFKVVQDDSINAFALPGGPMYVHTGLIKAADNEAQIAGVLAHELAHVVLRHGTNQATKAQITQIGALLAGAASGRSLAGQLTRLGIGLGAHSVLLSFSRAAESDADLLGAHIMARAGYNPVEMARFFEKLEGQERDSNGARLAAFFTASHPNPGHRVKAIEDQLPYMPRSSYDASEGELAKMQAAVAKLPPAPKRAAGQGSATPATRSPALTVSSTTRPYEAAGFRLSYPDNWRLSTSRDSVYIIPPQGVVGDSIAYGVIIGARPGRVNLDADTRALLRRVAERDPSARDLDPPRPVTVAGADARRARISADSPYEGTREIDLVVTIDGKTSLYSIVCVSPEPDFAKLEPVFLQIVESFQLK
jgi:predicted Zn-dependent protease